MKKQKHIMLFFLSVFSLDRPNKLRYSNYYDLKGKKTSGCHTNENALSYVCSQVTLDKIFVLTTKAVQQPFTFTDRDISEQELSHLELFIRKMEEKYKGIREKLVTIDFDETASAAKYYMPVVEMADKIEAELVNNQSRGEETCLHVDITGGKRDTSLLMSLVMQLLQYDGIRLEEVLYNNYDYSSKRGLLEDNTAIFDMTKLLSGAEAFVQYGSVTVLKTYFKNKSIEKSPQLEALLLAMGNFADGLNLCRTGLLEDSIAALKERLQAFKAQPGPGLQEKLFAKLLARVELDYEPILRDQLNKFDIIRWCIKKNYLQQAMTLYTEWMPEEIVARGIATPCSKAIENSCRASAEKYVPWEKHLLCSFKITDAKLSNYQKFSGENQSAAAKAIVKKIRIYFHEALNPGPRFDSLKAMYRYRKEIDEIEELIRQGEQAGSAMRSGKLRRTEFAEAYPKCYRLVEAMKPPSYKGGLGQYCTEKLTSEAVYKYMEHVPVGEYIYIMGITADNRAKEPEQELYPELKASADPKTVNRMRLVKKLVSSGVIRTKGAELETLAIIQAYLDNKSLRNQTNHAMGDTEYLPKWRLLSLLLRSMKRIEGFKKSN